MTNPTDENKSSMKDIKSETQDKLNLDFEAPPPPYETEGATSSKTSTKIFGANRIDTKTEKTNFNQNSIPKQIEPSVQPIYNHYHHNYYNNNSPQQQEHFQQDGSTIVYIEGNDNYNLSRDQYPQQNKRTCLEKYWKPVIDPYAWKSLLYFLFIAPVIALFSFVWCLVMFVHAIISLILPPIGFFFCIGTALSFRALGRLELITARMCSHKHKPAHLYPPVFRTEVNARTDKGILQYGIKICLDKYTMMCFVYFVFVNFVCTTIAWVLVFFFFMLAFSPLMIVAMPLMCIICLNFGRAKVKMSEGVLIKV
ncbi:hypothetical protein C1645_784379 [Glomus cerebriforme]|uniref:Sensor domain-containing protein n=1 Tax=Glomus cerebriforme TaxID=658196 RepID=A0A397SDE2_9GLOM|nr:hypothetical protein C1645_784379 [Glomus cerebriforme]